MSFKNFIVIADDLTGAGDIAFFTSKYKNILSQKIINFDFNLESLENINIDFNSDILIINTNSRFDDRNILEKKLKNLFDVLFCRNLITSETLIFKKIDSTLRGNFATEIEIIDSILSIDKIYFIPAYPEYKRWIKDKNLYIDDLLLEKTNFSKDPKNPIKISSIPKIIEKQLKNKNLVEKFLIEDIKDIDDFRLKIKNILGKREGVKYEFYAGSARFFGEILSNLYKNKLQTKIFTQKFKNFLAISGSFNSISKNQNIHFINFKKLNIIEESLKFLEIFTNHKNIYLFKTVNKKIENLDLEELIKFVKIYISQKNLKNSIYILYGGETAKIFMDFFNIKEINILYPLESGITLCSAKNTQFEKNEIYFILKPGGFGKINFLVDVYNRFIDF